MLLHPEFTKMSEDTQWPGTNIKLSIKHIDVNCTRGKFLILNWFSSSYVSVHFATPLNHWKQMFHTYRKKIVNTAQISKAPENVDFQSQQIHGTEEVIQQREQ